MANIPRRRFNAGPPPSQRFSPFREIGAAGYAVFGGRVVSREKGPTVTGIQRWVTFSEMVANTSIVAAGVRYFLNVISSAQWTMEPAEGKGGQEAADFVDDVLNDMVTPWRRIARRSSSYRFQGFGINEWTAKRRKKDGKIGYDDIEARPQHTIERWDVDDRGTVLGVWQHVPQTGTWIYLPRRKVMYLVEDSLSDSPEGLGLYRHLIEPYERLKKYLLLEGQGFERDFRGIPVGRVPYQAIRAAVKAGTLTDTDAANLTSAIENFVKMQTKSEDTSIVLDSVPYVVETESGQSISSVMQYGLELLQGQSADFPGLNQALDRTNQEMARILGVEHLLLGSNSGSANRALSEDKSRNFYLTANGTLDDIADGANKDIVVPICDMNGIAEEARPKVKHSDVSFRAIQEITGALRDLATAGAVLQPNDPAINDIRDLLGIKQAPDLTPEQLGAMTPPAPGATPPGGSTDATGTAPPPKAPVKANGAAKPTSGAGT